MWPVVGETMPRTGAFDAHFDRYEEWFEENRRTYEAEVRLLAELVPREGDGLEIGVGTGRFALPLGIRTGVEPSRRMAEIARQRGVKVVDGVAEDLPFDDASFDVVLMVTTICFVDDPAAAFSEAYRVLRNGGCFVVGFVDGTSRLGREYLAKRDESRFYKEATFFSAGEVSDLFRKADFSDLTIKQTLLERPEEIADGHGDGGFVGMKGLKRDRS